LARKILLADDSVTAQNMGRKILADAGYDVVTVNNGSAALKRITEIKPDLIVLDVYMPGYSGLEVCQRLKDAEETAHIPVLLTVGKLEPFKPEEARRVRADAHIVKPFEASELLTAITKLEDRMVPQHADGTRFNSSVSGMERFGGESRKADGDTDADTGWKSRLRFPSKKKKEDVEPEPETEDSVGATFRDFRKGKGKTGGSAPFTVKAPAPPGQETGLVPDIPRDITPEELDALSALAAKLDGPNSAVEVAASKTEDVKVEAEVPAGVAETKTEATLEAQPEQQPVEKIEATKIDAQKEAEPAASAGSVGQVEIPVEHTEPAAVPEEASGLLVTVPVRTASLAEEPAPVDRTDEPRFASEARAVEQALEEKIAEAKAEEKIEEAPVAAVAEVEVTEAPATVEAVAAKDQDSKVEEPKAEESKVESVESKEEAVVASAPEAAEAEEPAPSEEELAQALRLLTPSTGQGDESTVPSHGTLVAVGQLLAEEAARHATGAPRWVAEPVALSVEESAVSLEAEMFRTFATTPATIAEAVSSGAIDGMRITGVSAITAAVENRLASMDLAGNLAGSAPHVDVNEPRLAEPVLDGKGTETPSPATVPAMEAVAVEASVSEAVAVENAEADKIEASEIAEEKKESAAKAVEGTPSEDAVTATFADAMSQGEVEDTVQQTPGPASETAAAATATVAEENQDSSPEVGSEESMAKDGKAKWHQIHTAPAGTAAASVDVVEAAKHGAQAAEEAPKAMAAAAAEGTASVSAPDAGAIASIVDSVMADLRPRIVEEIARKLAGK
jgi:CheY-like chemotaxis protein